jgi:hypothetical protein
MMHVSRIHKNDLYWIGKILNPFLNTLPHPYGAMGLFSTLEITCKAGLFYIRATGKGQTGPFRFSISNMRCKQWIAYFRVYYSIKWHMTENALKIDILGPHVATDNFSRFVQQIRRFR